MFSYEAFDTTLACHTQIGRKGGLIQLKSEKYKFDIQTHLGRLAVKMGIFNQNLKETNLIFGVSHYPLFQTLALHQGQFGRPKITANEIKMIEHNVYIVERR